MKIAYCLIGLHRMGGLERVTTVKVNALVARGHEIYVITTDQAGRPNQFPLDPRIKCIDLGVNYEEYESLPRLQALRRMPEKVRLHRQLLDKLLHELAPDITVAAGYREDQVVGYCTDGSIKVNEHHNSKHFESLLYRAALQGLEHPSWRDRLHFGVRMLWGRLLTWWSARYDRTFDVLALLTEEDQQACSHHPRTVAIHNPRPFVSEEVSPLTERVILAAGRITGQKNFPELVSIFALIARDFPDWKLRIVGDGHQREALLARIRALGLDAQVELLPFSHEMPAVYKQASIYAMTSVYEGFGMVLIEAEEMGLPVVSYAFPCGARDIIRDGVDGFLVEEGDRETFAKRLSQLMTDAELRQKMGRKAKENSDRFALPRIMDQWEALFEQLLQERR